MEDLEYKEKKIVFCSIQEYCQITHMPISAFINDKTSSIKDGCCIIDKRHGINIILYNELLDNFERKNWSLAHEVGHIYMGHTEDDSIEEVEANFFAAQLFMPEFTLHMMKKKYGKLYAEDLTEIFNVSYSAAQKRLDSFKRMTFINNGKNDKAIWNRQRERIELYYDCKNLGLDYRFILRLQNTTNQRMYRAFAGL